MFSLTIKRMARVLGQQFQSIVNDYEKLLTIKQINEILAQHVAQLPNCKKYLFL